MLIMAIIITQYERYLFNQLVKYCPLGNPSISMRNVLKEPMINYRKDVYQKGFFSRVFKFIKNDEKPKYIQYNQAMIKQGLAVR